MQNFLNAGFEIIKPYRSEAA